MDFSLSEDQTILQATLDRTLAAICPLARIRSHAETPNAFADDVWTSLCALGLPGVLVPAEHGGLGLGALDAALIGERLGRFAVPSPFLSAAVLTPRLIAGCAAPERQAALLPRIAEGTLRCAVGIAELVSGRRVGEALLYRGGRLSGDTSFVLDPAGASHLLLLDGEGNVFLLPADAPGLEVVGLDSVDRTRSAAQVRCGNVEAERLGRLDGGGLRATAALARLLLAADLLGAAQEMLDRAVDYAKQRRQFGRPIGSFQAVKHLCAEMAAELEPCRSLLWYAGHAWDRGFEDAEIACLHAKALLSDAGRFVARTATEVHGGMGITDELGLHFWFKRIGWSYQMLGGPERLRDEAALVQGLIEPAAFGSGRAPPAAQRRHDLPGSPS